MELLVGDLALLVLRHWHSLAREVYERFRDAFVARTRLLRIGDRWMSARMSAP
ncbi:hypothetical protein [Streptomyces sp. 3214.6]|uniref:hypothetical protein n=1 Tax=Streptomyces sp. 3214.6 TaxID=1882757 RepID=UPI001E4784BA|nr:hypothetical protein [Streptomyces sp. 3214.6]